MKKVNRKELMLSAWERFNDRVCKAYESVGCWTAATAKVSFASCLKHEWKLAKR